MVAEPEEYTPRSRRILEIANREAMRFRASAIGTEHLLIAILRRNRLCCGTAVIFPWCAAQKVYQDIVLGIGMDAGARQICRRPRASRGRKNDL